MSARSIRKPFAVISLLMVMVLLPANGALNVAQQALSAPSATTPLIPDHQQELTPPDSSRTGGLSDGLLGYYPLNGNANDESGNGNDGVAQGRLDVVGGRIGAAYQFYDSTSTIATPIQCYLGDLQDWTISVWVYPSFCNNWPKGEFPDIGTGHSIINADYPGWGGLAIGIDRDEVRTLFNGNYPNWLSFGYEFSPENWYHLVGVWDYTHDQVSIYVNGRLIGAQSASFASMPYYASFEIGMTYLQGAWQFPLNGILDEIRIFNRVLDESEIQALYQLGFASIPVNETLPQHCLASLQNCGILMPTLPGGAHHGYHECGFRRYPDWGDFQSGPV